MRFILFFATFFLLFSLPLLSHAHVHLDKASPSENEVLVTPPTSVKLWFTGRVEAAWSKIKVVDSQGNRVDEGDVASINNDPKTLTVPLKSLGSGTYEVNWNIVANDGHRIKGKFSFTVK